jgi:hypothetical protein
MDAKEYSLKDIFAILRDATINLHNKNVVLVTEDKDGKDIEIKMELPDYIAMSVGYQIHTTTNSDDAKDYVIAAMAAAGYDEVAYPNHESFGVRMSRGDVKVKKSRKTRKSKKSKFNTI